MLSFIFAVSLALSGSGVEGRGGLSRVRQYSNFVTSMRHIIIIIVLLFQTRVESSRAVLEVGVGSGEWGERRVKIVEWNWK